MKVKIICIPEDVFNDLMHEEDLRKTLDDNVIDVLESYYDYEMPITCKPEDLSPKVLKWLKKEGVDV